MGGSLRSYFMIFRKPPYDFDVTFLQPMSRQKDTHKVFVLSLVGVSVVFSCDVISRYPVRVLCSFVLVKIEVSPVVYEFCHAT